MLAGSRQMEFPRKWMRKSTHTQTQTPTADSPWLNLTCYLMLSFYSQTIHIHIKTLPPTMHSGAIPRTRLAAAVRQGRENTGQLTWHVWLSSSTGSYTHQEDRRSGTQPTTEDELWPALPPTHTHTHTHQPQNSHWSTLSNFYFKRPQI